jgi:hypothetical protein
VIAALNEERIDTDIKYAAASLGHRCERSVDLAFVTRSQYNELQPKRTCTRLRVSQLAVGIRKIRIHECRDYRGAGNGDAGAS